MKGMDKQHTIIGWVRFKVPGNDCTPVGKAIDATIERLGGNVVDYGYSRDDFSDEEFEGMVNIVTPQDYPIEPGRSPSCPQHGTAPFGESPCECPQDWSWKCSSCGSGPTKDEKGILVANHFGNCPRIDELRNATV
jgi:hypothetical protein